MRARARFVLVQASSARCNISVTPALFWLSRPLGALTDGINADGSVDRSSNFGILGGLVQTTIRF